MNFGINCINHGSKWIFTELIICNIYNKLQHYLKLIFYVRTYHLDDVKIT